MEEFWNISQFKYVFIVLTVLTIDCIDCDLCDCSDSIEGHDSIEHHDCVDWVDYVDYVDCVDCVDWFDCVDCVNCVGCVFCVDWALFYKYSFILHTLCTTYTLYAICVDFFSAVVICAHLCKKYNKYQVGCLEDIVYQLNSSRINLRKQSSDCPFKCLNLHEYAQFTHYT